MKQNYITEAGRIDKKGRLLLPMDRLGQEFSKHKGCRVVARFMFMEPGSSEALLGYYYGYVVPTITAALYEQGTRFSPEKTDLWLIHQYPGDREIAPGEYAEKGSQLSQPQMLDFLEWLKEYAAENLDTYIEDPKLI